MANVIVFAIRCISVETRSPDCICGCTNDDTCDKPITFASQNKTAVVFCIMCNVCSACNADFLPEPLSPFSNSCFAVKSNCFACIPKAIVESTGSKIKEKIKRRKKIRKKRPIVPFFVFRCSVCNTTSSFFSGRDGTLVSLSSAKVAGCVCVSTVSPGLRKVRWSVPAF